MDLAFSLILAFLSIGQSYTEQAIDPSTCLPLCPSGYHKESECTGTAVKYKCKKCGNDTYTAIPNAIEKCPRCDHCGKNQVQIQPCSFNSNRECACQKGFYNYASIDADRWCKQCPQTHYSADKISAEVFQQCMLHNECKKICISTTFMTMTTITTRAATSNNTPLNPVVDPFPTVKYLPLMFLMPVVVTVVGLFMLLQFFRNVYRYFVRCPCWGTNKDLELPAVDPESNEKHRHQACGPTTLTFNISEETPMMTVTESSDHPAHIYPLVPDTEHKAARQEKESEHWPAIILYAIIKEVPLRRWKEFLRLLSVADQQLERVELEAGLGLGFTERQYQMLRLWSQCPSARLSDVFSALHYMDLSGCAQLLQESLEKMQWRPDPM